MQADGKIDGRLAPARRTRALVAAYESQLGDALSPAMRSLIRRAVAIEIAVEAIEADQVAGRPFDAEKHARLAGGLARLLERIAGKSRSRSKVAFPIFWSSPPDNADTDKGRR